MMLLPSNENVIPSPIDLRTRSTPRITTLGRGTRVPQAGPQIATLSDHLCGYNCSFSPLRLGVELMDGPS
ncbi:hypothetical protein P154DRAFT_516560 [Amniculicola lignicola CBS 123094]|uniref:Uncharacterized protein n=1 Tax=Amniculicola lignicola CBS 123094 TaxID=1392246 RepID=A0A6A5X479_9PLEO|nr:hypothetical protein P154DRAFT_516560 [Amniculicola lignicola CBS 123094]